MTAKQAGKRTRMWAGGVTAAVTAVIIGLGTPLGHLQAANPSIHAQQDERLTQPGVEYVGSADVAAGLEYVQTDGVRRAACTIVYEIQPDGPYGWVKQAKQTMAQISAITGVRFQPGGKPENTWTLLPLPPSLIEETTRVVLKWSGGIKDREGFAARNEQRYLGLARTQVADLGAPGYPQWRITSSDIAFNWRKLRLTDPYRSGISMSPKAPAPAYNPAMLLPFRILAAHEIAHAMGLAHSEDTATIMNPQPRTYTGRQTIDPTTAQRLKNLYESCRVRR